MNGARVELRSICKKYDDACVLQPLDLVVEQGEFFALLGPSGSGKSTLLGTIAGFIPPSSGEVVVNGDDITGVPPHRRNLGMVFQNYSLFPYLTVYRNIAFPLEMRRVRPKEIKQAVARVLDMVQLSHMADRLPAQLSGGQQQRVALARAAVYDPPLLLMDEPLGALDKNLREDLQQEIREFHRKVGATIIYVTHDQYEAAAMADRLAILRNGRIEQCGSPHHLYNHPGNSFVAGFLGEANLFEITSKQEGIENGNADVIAETRQGVRLIAARSPQDDAAIAYIRPESIVINPSSSATLANVHDAIVDDIVNSGGSLRYRLRVTDNCVLTARKPNDRSIADLPLGEKVRCAWDSKEVVFVPR
ncbi:ABC transporter ATP-binding protein [Caballeronia cordobensis]|uniref:ABC transporter ATP-binding protein n=1 Tax=Caballeronia cordobensis TaxID=1353886 RepID=UPI00045EFF4A|nr:putative membrane protein [Burkholderia sp. RPE67]